MSAPTETPHRRPSVAMIPFPGLTMLDLIGPYETLREHTDVHLLHTTTDEFFSDSGAPFRATERLADAADHYDVIFVPGGNGTADAMRDPEVIDFLATRGPRARYVTSVCTGSLVLGAAGLLDGYRATTHWSMLDALPLFGAVPTQQRVVIDGNRITGGGVTAGIDFGLILLAEMFDEETARYAQLLLEYDPHPPFDSGSPRSTSRQAVQRVREYVAPLLTSCERFVTEKGGGTAEYS
ncbi:DJ-1/PfpI family protein [Mycobacterium sp. E2462]|uniref:DJ-1/PfpI family protein n=1 Tax=Mycobacterium sp. E2462 TaxID=1834133 RepID=UPI001E2D0072|nr:DJ-1/PfpI family protein [Mycobacterium sp. E2462]